jgi:hypothetical protein
MHPGRPLGCERHEKHGQHEQGDRASCLSDTSKLLNIDATAVDQVRS